MGEERRNSLEGFMSGFLALMPLYVIQVVPPPESLHGGMGDLLLAPWALVILAGTAGLGYWRGISALNLVLSSIAGMLVGYLFIAMFVGWSYVMFPVALITAAPIIVGAGISYWIKKRK